MSNIPTIDLNNGKKMPAFGLGTWLAEAGEVEASVKVAIDAGYRHIDCAHVYGNEDEIGTAIKQKIDEGAIKREDLFVTSKLWNTFHHPKSVRKALETTLKNLRIKYLDLYLIHWPMSYKEDGDNLFPLDKNEQYIDGGADLADTWRAMEECVDAGLTKSIGVSNFNRSQIDYILSNARIRPVINQVECHPYLNQKRLKDYCESKDIHITGYSPLGSPRRPWAVEGEPNLIEEPKILEVAKAHKKSAAQVILRYQIQRGNAVIPKSVHKERILSNMDIFDFELSDKEMKVIDSFDRNGRLCAETPAINHRDYPFQEGVEF